MTNHLSLKLRVESQLEAWKIINENIATSVRSKRGVWSLTFLRDFLWNLNDICHMGAAYESDKVAILSKVEYPVGTVGT